MRAFDIYARYRYTYVRIICIIREFLKTKAMLKVCQQAWKPMKHANCSESSIWYNCNKNDKNGDSCNKKNRPKSKYRTQEMMQKASLPPLLIYLMRKVHFNNNSWSRVEADIFSGWIRSRWKYSSSGTLGYFFTCT